MHSSSHRENPTHNRRAYQEERGARIFLAITGFRNYNNCMEITFDPAKDKSNQRKHGVALSHAAQIDWVEVVAKVDTRQDYGEVREIGYAVVAGRLYCVVFTRRAGTMHVISLRKANSREVRNYEQT